jgi:hypothetical protein
MKNLIYISSIIAAIIWSFCFVLIQSTPAIHFLLIAGFIGIIATVYLDERKQISK